MTPAARSVGIALAALCAILPAFPLGPIVASPPLPIAALWLAYGWAASGDPGWGRPVFLFGLGLLQDQLAGGPLGLMAALNLFGYLFGMVTSGMTRSHSLITEWGGFAAAAVSAALVTVLVGRLALDVVGLRPFAVALAITVILFPLVRPIYTAKPAAAAGGQA